MAKKKPEPERERELTPMEHALVEIDVHIFGALRQIPTDPKCPYLKTVRTALECSRDLILSASSALSERAAEPECKGGC